MVHDLDTQNLKKQYNERHLRRFHYLQVNCAMTNALLVEVLATLSNGGAQPDFKAIFLARYERFHWDDVGDRLGGMHCS